MPLILAIEPDRRQGAQLTALAHGALGADLVLADTTESAIKALDGRVPDLILTSAFLSPKDEDALADCLRTLDAAAAHVQTLTIPVLAAPVRRRKNDGVLSRLRWQTPKAAAPDGCDPKVFAEQITEYLKRSAAERERLAAAAGIEEDDRNAAIIPEPPCPVVVQAGATIWLEAPAESVSVHSVGVVEPRPLVEFAPEPEPVFLASIADLEAIARQQPMPGAMAERSLEESIEAAPQADAAVLLDAGRLDLSAFLGELETVAAHVGSSDVHVVDPPELVFLEAAPAAGSAVMDVAAGDLVGAPVIEDAAAIETTAEWEPEPIADAGPWMALPLQPYHAWPRLEGFAAEAAPVAVDLVDAELAIEMDEAELTFELVDAEPTIEQVVEAAPPNAPAGPVAPQAWGPVLVAAPPEAACQVPPVSEPDPPEWLDMLANLRHDIERLQAERAERVVPSRPADRAPLATPVNDQPVASNPTADPTAPSRKKRRKKAPAVIQNEWGFFDPDQCGFAALVAKLDEISETKEDRPAKRRA